MLQSSIRRGELDRQVTFLVKIVTVGAANSDQLQSWTEVEIDPTVWAKKKDLRGQDVVEAERLTYTQRTVWTVDYREDITSANRLYDVDREKVYEIIAVTETEGSRKRYLDVMTNLLDTELWT